MYTNSHQKLTNIVQQPNTQKSYKLVPLHKKTTTTFSPKIKLSNYHPLFATWLDSFNKTLLKLFFL